MIRSEQYYPQIADKNWDLSAVIHTSM